MRNLREFNEDYALKLIYIQDKGEHERIEVTVKTAKDFIRAIGSNRNILLEEGTYTLIGYQTIQNEKVSWLGSGPLVSKVQNMSIRGIGSKPSELISYGITFSYSNNISIENVTASLPKKTGESNSGVFDFSNSSNIKIDNTHIRGIGRFGLKLYDVKNMEVTNSTISESAKALMSIYDSENLHFKNCTFHDNRGDSMFESGGSTQNVVFENCEFRDNKFSDSEILAVPEQFSWFTFKDCVFTPTP